MKKIIWISALLILSIVQCTNNKNAFTIKGELNTKNYDGEYIYLVPFKNATIDRVDSALIKDGKFFFEGNIEQPELCILRARPLIRLKLQELLIVKEPGNINVELSNNSSARGTASNDSLQDWKNHKLEYDSQFRMIMKQSRESTDSTEQEQLMLKLDSFKIQRDQYYKAFIKNNSKNSAGKIVQELLYPNQPPNQ